MLALALPSDRPVRPQPRPSLMVLASAGPSRLPHVDLRTLIRLRLGDVPIQEEFVRVWQPVLANEVRRYAVRGGDADELQAEANAALWEAVIEYDPSRHRTQPASYVHNAVHRRVRRSYREQMGYDHPSTGSLTLLPEAGAEDPGLTVTEQRLDLTAAIAQLNPMEQVHFMQYLALAAGGAGPDEAAYQLSVIRGESMAASKKRLQRSRQKVREQLFRR